MKIQLFQGANKLCILKTPEDTPQIPPRECVNRILDFFRDGDWLWINRDSKAVRYDSITSLEIVPEETPEELMESGT